MDASVAHSRPLTAIVLRLGAALALTTLSMLVKLSGEDGVHLAEIIFWRQLVTLIVIVAFAAATVGLTTLKPVRFKQHAIRSAYGITGMAMVYGAVILLPLAEATTVNFTTPIFAVLLSMLLMKDRIGPYRWTAVALGFIGILIVAQPGNSPIDPLGLALGLGGAFMVALISIQIQDLNKTESSASIVFWFCLLTVPLLAVALPFVGKAHASDTWLLLLGVGLSGAVGQLLLTNSLRYGSAATVIVMDYTALLWATLYGWQVFGDLPVPNTWIGAPIIILAGTIIVVREGHLRRKARRSAAPEEPLAPPAR